MSLWLLQNKFYKKYNKLRVQKASNKQVWNYKKITSWPLKLNKTVINVVDKLLYVTVKL